jgi:hypothetical protein
MFQQMITQMAQQKRALHEAYVALEFENATLKGNIARLIDNIAHSQSSNAQPTVPTSLPSPPADIPADIAKIQEAAPLWRTCTNLQAANSTLNTQNQALQQTNDSLRTANLNVLSSNANLREVNAKLEAQTAKLISDNTRLEAANTSFENSQAARKETMRALYAARIEDRKLIDSLEKTVASLKSDQGTDAERYASVAVQATPIGHDSTKQKIASVLAANKQLLKSRKQDQEHLSLLRAVQAEDESTIATLQDKIVKLEAAKASCTCSAGEDQPDGHDWEPNAGGDWGTEAPAFWEPDGHDGWELEEERRKRARLV